MMDDQTYANMMESSQWNFAQKKFPLWEYPMKPIKNKNQRIPFNLFQTATVRNKAQLLFFFRFFFISFFMRPCIIISQLENLRG